MTCDEAAILLHALDHERAGEEVRSGLPVRLSVGIEGLTGLGQALHDRHRLAGKRGFIEAEDVAGDEQPVRRQPVSLAHEDDILGHELQVAREHDKVHAMLGEKFGQRTTARRSPRLDERRGNARVAGAFQRATQPDNLPERAGRKDHAVPRTN